MANANRIKVNGNTIRLDTMAWYVRPECIEEPVREGYVENIFDDCVKVWDRYLGDVYVDLDKIFDTEDKAQAAFKDNERKEALALVDKAMGMLAEAMAMLKKQ